jgi:hypothetical protein
MPAMSEADIWSIDTIVLADQHAMERLSERIGQVVASWVEEDDQTRQSIIVQVRVGDRSRRERRGWHESFAEDRQARAAADQS